MHQKRWLHSDNFTKKKISLSFWLCCLRLPFSFKVRDYYVIVYNASFPQGQVEHQNTEYVFFLKSLWKASTILRLNCQNKGRQAGFFGFLQTAQRHHLQQSRRWFAGNRCCARDINVYGHSATCTRQASFALCCQATGHSFVRSSLDLTYFHPRRCNFILGEN